MKRFARRAVMAAVVTAACGAGLLPGTVARAQVIAEAGNTPVLAAWDGNNNSLDFYQRGSGPGWGSPEQVAGPGTTTSEPAVAQMGIRTGIAAEGANGSIDFYSQLNGATTWYGAQLVAGPGSTLWQPALAWVNRDAVIAVAGPGGVIDVYSEPIGSYSLRGHGPVWTEQQVSGFGSGSPAGPYGTPSITQAGDATVIAAQGPNATLYLFWQQIGSQAWHADQVAGAKSTYQAPSVAQIGDATVIAAGNEHDVYTYTQRLGASDIPVTGSDWPSDLVDSSTAGAGSPSIAQVDNSVVVANTVATRTPAGESSSSLKTFWQPISSDTAPWTAETVTGQGGYSGYAPSIAQMDDSVVIGVALVGNGMFYWESASGTGPWNAENVN
jgi:hypothetical protein